MTKRKRQKSRTLGEELLDPKTRKSAAAAIRRVGSLIGEDPVEIELEIARRLAVKGKP